MSLKSFNEPALTLMTGRVSDGKLICLRESVCVCVCVGVCRCTYGNFGEFVCVCALLSTENSLSEAHQAETFLTFAINMSGYVYS